MPTAVTHLLVPIILVALYRDLYVRKNGKRKFPLHYVLIAGLGGVLPDIDFVAYFILHFYGFAYDQVHRQITHSLIVPLSFLILGFLTSRVKPFILRKHHLTLKGIFFALSFGTLTHIILDALVWGQVHPFAPFSSFAYGLNSVSYLSTEIQPIIIPFVEGVLLVIWLLYLELKHKISDFI